jgi:hypothetical protein
MGEKLMFSSGTVLFVLDAEEKVVRLSMKR